MCGIAGIFSLRTALPDLLAAMTERLHHRGPDDDGCWIEAEAGIGLGHKRLTIVDLSSSGHQPMHSADGRYVISYNGEVYNHLEIRSELDAATRGERAWRGHSDTETLVEAIAEWGLGNTLSKAVGMFAFALWDKKERRLHLVRDRFGEKPLYYGWVGPDFLFASELKAMRAHPRFDNPIDRGALGLFAARSYVPAPLSIYERIYKLEPGCILTITAEGAAGSLGHPPEVGRREPGLSLSRYWSYRTVLEAGLDNAISDERDALDELERALATSIKGQSVADVPVGAFLSGGIDSSTVAALYQKYSPIPIRTFSIGFEEAGYDEARDARAVAARLGTVHNECYISVAEAREVIPLLPAIYDEPFGDSSQIPTFLVSRFARDQVKVALSGDGGDELFAGYNRHFAGPRLWRHLKRLPSPMRRAAAPLGRVPWRFWSNAVRALGGRHQPHLGAKIQKGFLVAGSARSFDDVYASYIDQWSFEPSPVRGGKGPGMPLDLDAGDGASDSLRVMYCDAVSYLPDDILCKVDRASMAVSLEARVPFLDHRVAEVAARIPMGMKVRNGQGKHILRQVLYREAPRELFERPKAGFAVPVGEWIKGPLRSWAEELLDRRRMAGDGWFDEAIVGRRWSDHLRGRRDSSQALWAVLMFQAWLRAQQDCVPHRQVAA